MENNLQEDCNFEIVSIEEDMGEHCWQGQLSDPSQPRSSTLKQSTGDVPKPGNRSREVSPTNLEVRKRGFPTRN